MSRTRNRLASAFGSFVAAMVIVCGVMYLPKHHFYFRGDAYSDFFGHLPNTLLLITASVILALAFAGIFHALSLRAAWLRAIIASVLAVVVCAPLFLLALIVEFAFAAHGISIIASKTQMLLPTALLAIIQAGSYLDSMRSGLSVRRLFATFALLLPVIISAGVFLELFFAWPGVGRTFFREYPVDHNSYMVAFLLISAGTALIVRVGAGTDSSEDRGSYEVFEPL